VNGIGAAILLISVLAGFTLFFSVNYMALRTFSPVRFQQVLKASNKKAESLTDSLVNNSEKLILTCSVFRLLFNVCMLITLMAILTAIKQRAPRISDYAVVFVVGTGLFLVFSLAIPHAWAKYAGEKLLSRTYRILLILAVVSRPVLYILGLYDKLIRRLSGATAITHDQKQEEFLTGLQQQRIEGVVDRQQQQIIENVLELSDKAADEIMTPRTDILAVELNSSLETILDTIIAGGYSRVPVYEGSIDNIVGLVYAKDLLGQVGKNAQAFELRDKMRKAYFVPETKHLRTLFKEFQNKKLHIAVVLDEYGGTAGIVTLEDIIEELVGEITDEYEETPAEAIKIIDQNTADTDARTAIDDLNDSLGLNLPEDEDYDTIGGFVLSVLGYIPKTGESFNYKSVRFTITAAETRRIKRIRIEKISE